MKKYRKINKNDKFPSLPTGVKPKFILKHNLWTVIFAEDKERRYTFEWDRVSSNYNFVQFNYKN